MRRLLWLCALAGGLAGCGIDGPPIRPEPDDGTVSVSGDLLLATASDAEDRPL